MRSALGHYLYAQSSVFTTPKYIHMFSITIKISHWKVSVFYARETNRLSLHLWQLPYERCWGICKLIIKKGVQIRTILLGLWAGPFTASWAQQTWSTSSLQATSAHPCMVNIIWWYQPVIPWDRHVRILTEISAQKRSQLSQPLSPKLLAPLNLNQSFV